MKAVRVQGAGAVLERISERDGGWVHVDANVRLCGLEDDMASGCGESSLGEGLGLGVK